MIFMLQFLKSNSKLISVLILSIASFFFGYSYNGYKNDSERLEYFEEQQLIIKELSEKESEIAAVVENRLSELSVNERIIETERLKIVEKPIYNISCIDEEGQSLIKKFAKGSEKP